MSNVAGVLGFAMRNSAWTRFSATWRWPGCASGLLDALARGWDRQPAELQSAVLALSKLLDLDLAIIEDAYQTERLARQQQIERLADLGQIAAGIAHELRNPLNVIKTSVYFLQAAATPRPRRRPSTSAGSNDMSSWPTA